MSIPVIQSKLPNVGTTIFTVMSGLANQYNAINLGQGFPDYQMNEELMMKVNEVMQKGWNQYVPMQGYMPLRESIAEKVEHLYHTKINPDTQITITPGGTYAIYTALTTILQPGDEVIIFGKEIPIQELANWAGTIPYEIMTGISERVKRVYYEE